MPKDAVMKINGILGACLALLIAGCTRETALEPVNIEIAVDLDGNITINGEAVSTCDAYYEKLTALAPDFQVQEDCPLSFQPE